MDMKPTRRNFLKAAAAFCAAPLAWLLRKPTIITVNNKPQYEGHVPQVIPAGESWLFTRSNGEWVPVAKIEKWMITGKGIETT